MSKAAFIYDPIMSKYVMREDHVLRPSRLQYTFELLEGYGAFQHCSPVKPPPAGKGDLLSFHTREYVEAVESLSQGKPVADPSIYNLSEWGDNPIFTGMYEGASLSVGGSLKAADMVADGAVEAAFNVAGGLHHAGPNFASGFCIFNDPAIAIHHLLQRGLKIAYVDIDAHHGDGVQNAFYDTNRVLTISLHESGRYLFPGTGDVPDMGTGVGKGYAVNLPLAPYTDEDVYCWAFEQIVPPLLGAFKPDIVVTQLGVDTHYLDPLAHLSLTTWGLETLYRRFKELAPRWVAVGGGGYDVSVVARAWALAYGVMLGEEWPDDVPPSYQERYGLKFLRDHEKPKLDEATRQRARSFAENTVQALQRLVFPVHHIA